MEYLVLLHAIGINIDKKQSPKLYNNYKNLLRKYQNVRNQTPIKK
jgi:hypothetical protein